MTKRLIIILKPALIVAALSIVSTGAHASGVIVANSTDWNMGVNHIMYAGGSISATIQDVDKDSFTRSSEFDGAGLGTHQKWYTFMTHEIADTKFSVTAINRSTISPAIAIWQTDGEFDGGVSSGTNEFTTSGHSAPHAFNQVGRAGDYGTWWMTDDSTAIVAGRRPVADNGGVGYAANGVLAFKGHASDGPAQASNGYGKAIGTDYSSDGHAELSISNLPAGWYVVFVGGANENSLEPFSSVDLKISSVPVPAAVYLFGSALLGLFASSRRK